MKKQRRKKKAREQERLNAKKDKSLLEKLREKKRIEMQNYRDKKKKEKLDNAIRTKSGKKNQATKKRTKSKKTYTEKKLNETKKKNAVIRTQKWRMKIKLRDLTSTDDSSEMDTVESAFPNRMAENRALRKVKDNLIYQLLHLKEQS